MILSSKISNCVPVSEWREHRRRRRVRTIVGEIHDERRNFNGCVWKEIIWS
ncbi:unnamed protein product [Brassica oleracea]|uniref:(rape) hypothetical protein n=1 Tax=Brassica napus TaxID=3708 RepID=A0A816MGL9_BRANA|nr:unnamed protein product [Brassica napus]